MNIYPAEYLPEHLPASNRGIWRVISIQFKSQNRCTVTLASEEQKEHMFSRSTFESLGSDLDTAHILWYGAVFFSWHITPPRLSSFDITTKKDVTASLD